MTCAPSEDPDQPGHLHMSFCWFCHEQAQYNFHLCVQFQPLNLPQPPGQMPHQHSQDASSNLSAGSYDRDEEVGYIGIVFTFGASGTGQHSSLARHPWGPCSVHIVDVPVLGHSGLCSVHIVDVPVFDHSGPCSVYIVDVPVLSHSGPCSVHIVDVPVFGHSGPCSVDIVDVPVLSHFGLCSFHNVDVPVFGQWFLPGQAKKKGRSCSIGSASTWHACGLKFDSHVQHILSWRLGSWKNIYGHSPSSTDSRRAVVKLLAKECALSLVNCLWGFPRNSVVRVTDCAQNYLKCVEGP